jgi:MoaA/NifB/PqqE/SkfB family radical SAM enzyme
MEENKICLNPWNYLCIEYNGNCYFCCSIFLKNKEYIGNILEQDINEIWNGEKAKTFRQNILDKKYTFCNTKMCKNIYTNAQELYQPINNNNPLISNLPVYIQLNYDHSCSQHCIFCRDKIEIFSKEEEEKWNNIIHCKFIPLFANAKILSLSGNGELFDSNHSRILIKELLSTYPNIKTEIWSNAIKFNEKNLKELNLIDRIRIAHFSIHAADENTYKKIWKTNNFKTVQDNLNYAAQLKKEKKINSLIFSFVINKKNYKNMKKFVLMAEKYGAETSFTIAHHKGAKYTSRERNYAIFKQNHYLYNDFVKMIKDPFFQEHNCNMDFDSDLKPISGIQIIKNLINIFS